MTQGILNWKKCKVCGKMYDFKECPFCRIKKKKEEQRDDEKRIE